MIKYYVKIDGIYCDHCRETIEKALSSLSGVSSAKVRGNIACVNANADISESIRTTVLRLGYITRPEWIQTGYNRRKLLDFLEISVGICMIVLIRRLLRSILGYDILNVIPVIDSNLSLAAVFAAGLMTGLHCVGMCGAINLVASSDRKHALIYNLGRISCYTAVGFIVGLAGSFFSFSPKILGTFTVCVSVIMLLMGISMTGLIALPRTRCFRKTNRKPYGAFLLGVLNGFVPCGPLTAMQLYALSTAAPLKGALSLFLFGLGTTPLMLGFGIMQSLFEKRKALIQKICSLLVIVLAFSMLLRGLSALGISVQNNPDPGPDQYQTAEVKDGSQYIRITADYGSYGDFAVKSGIPVVLVIEMPEGRLTGCNNEVICDDLGFSGKLHEGENTLTFTPEVPGEYHYYCWMYMIQNRILVK